MKVIAVCLDNVWARKPFTNSKSYPSVPLRQTYGRLSRRARKKGLKLIITDLNWYDKRKQTFRKGWEYDEHGEWVHTYDFKADAVFNKQAFLKKYTSLIKYFSRKGMILNPFYIEELCSDKLKTYKTFKDLVPLTLSVRNKRELLTRLDSMPTSKVVLKPRFGSDGQDVVVTNKTKIRKNPPKVGKDTLLQACVEPKNTTMFRFPHGSYDLRVIVVQGKIVDQFYRVAPKGLLVSNVVRGGKVIFTRKENIPKQVLKVVRTIDKKLTRYNPRIYSLDFMIDENNKPWLIEMNSKLGIIFISEYMQSKREAALHGVILSALKAISL